MATSETVNIVIFVVLMLPNQYSLERNKACELLVVIDEPLFLEYEQSEENVQRLAYNLVKGLNEIYQRSFFRDHLSQFFFFVKNVEILYDFCEDCNQTQTVFLNEFSKLDSSGYCLSLLLTHRDFPQGVQGLAWRNTVCANRYNTGFITFINHQTKATEEESLMTLAHEVGHNFGAFHDEDTECRENSASYIMGRSGSSDPYLQFSRCSLQNMQARMYEMLDKPEQNCFVDRLQDETLPGFCGNHIVEPGEQCDCGLDFRQCKDPCCYPGHLTTWHMKQNESARPCHFNMKTSCLDPWQSFLTFGIVMPWVAISVLIALVCIGLIYDWRKDKVLYVHLKKPDEKHVNQTGALVSELVRNRWDQTPTPTDTGKRSIKSPVGVKAQIAKLEGDENQVNGRVFIQSQYSMLPQKETKPPRNVKASSIVGEPSSLKPRNRVLTDLYSPSSSKSPVNLKAVPKPVYNVGKSKSGISKTAGVHSGYTAVPQRPAPKPELGSLKPIGTAIRGKIASSSKSGGIISPQRPGIHKPGYSSVPQRKAPSPPSASSK